MNYYIIIKLNGKENKVNIKTNKNTTILGGLSKIFMLKK